MDATDAMDATNTDVLVVGAGPTGLMLANWLTRLGVDHLVVDGKAGPTRESRALVLQARSMEIYDQLGMIDAVRDRAVPAPAFVPGFENHRSARPIPLAVLGRALTPYPGLHVLEQSVNEELLLAHLRATREAPGEGDVVRWRTRVVALEQDADGVTVGLGPAGSGPDGAPEASDPAPRATQTVRARYVVACDGARSTVRHQVGIDFSGKTNPDLFWVLDGVGVTGLTPGAVNVRAARDRILLAFPMDRGDRHRLIGTVRDDEPTFEGIRASLVERFGIDVASSNWFTTYRLHHRIADRFRSGRVFLAGDAAHVHSPVGGQGMNTGLQDAHGLAMKLAAVLAGQAGDDLLDHHEIERRPVAERLVATTDRLFSAVTSQKPAAVRLRRMLAPTLAALLPTVGPRLPVAQRLAGYVGQVRVHYRATAGDTGPRDAVVGRRLPWTGTNFDVLRACDVQVHAYGATAPEAADLPRLVGAVHRFDARPDLGLPDRTALLVRPDGFVAARGRVDDPALGRAFADALGALGYDPDAPSRRG